MHEKKNVALFLMVCFLQPFSQDFKQSLTLQIRISIFRPLNAGLYQAMRSTGFMSLNMCSAIIGFCENSPILCVIFSCLICRITVQPGVLFFGLAIFCVLREHWNLILRFFLFKPQNINKKGNINIFNFYYLLSYGRPTQRHFI